MVWGENLAEPNAIGQLLVFEPMRETNSEIIKISTMSSSSSATIDSSGDEDNEALPPGFRLTDYTQLKG